MRLVKLDPPGTLCTYEALRQVIARTGPTNFIDAGCGGGNYSKLLCSLGMTGVGIDFSGAAIDASRKTLSAEISSGRYTLIEGDLTTLALPALAQDLGISVMVIEHVEDDVGFVRTLRGLVRPGGIVAICVPGRRDCWSFEDETVGHLRRYDREDLKSVLESAGLTDVEIWSVAVPTANILLRFGSWLIRNSAEANKVGLDRHQQTETSGLQAIPWKTMFPAWMRVILNRYTLYPLLQMQRVFYRTDLGVTMLGFGRVPAGQ